VDDKRNDEGKWLKPSTSIDDFVDDSEFASMPGKLNNEDENDNDDDENEDELDEVYEDIRNNIKGFSFL